MPRSAGRKSTLSPGRKSRKSVKLQKEPEEAAAPGPRAEKAEIDVPPQVQTTVNNATARGRYRPPQYWIEEVLQAHNVRRGLHWAPPLIWSDECFEMAKRQADACTDQKHLSNGHVDCMSGRMGQCVLGPPRGPWRVNRPGMAENIVSQWYGESKGYNYDHPGFRQQNSNFLQVIWFNTTSVGMAVSRDGRYCVANYFPAGHDVLLEPPQEKAVRNYFPAATFPSGFPSGPLEDRLEKERRYFRANVKSVQDAPAPWLCLPPEPKEEEPAEENRSSSPMSKMKPRKSKSKGKMSRESSRKKLPALVRKVQLNNQKGKANLSGMVAAVAAAAMAENVSKGSSGSLIRSQSSTL